MKKAEIKVGEAYLVKVSGKVVPVRIDRAAEGRNGWYATNLKTNRGVFIKSAQRIRSPVYGMVQAKPATELGGFGDGQPGEPEVDHKASPAMMDDEVKQPNQA